MFSGVVGIDFAADTGLIPDPVSIRGFRLIMTTYMTVGGTGLHEQVAAQEQGYTDWQEFVMAPCHDDLATGYLRYPFRIIPGSGLVVPYAHVFADDTSCVSDLDIQFQFPSLRDFSYQISSSPKHPSSCSSSSPLVPVFQLPSSSY